MADIAILADDVINQIAAGEVVERPASVVKELVENALDAGAQRIRIETDGGGKRFIRVVDDGHGMCAAEIELALCRHATSKLRVLSDLCDLGTLGFRGEALPSIASVSKMIISSRSRHMDAGARVVIDGGRVVERSEVGMPHGTQIEVHDLLEHVPARKKFLKADATESAQISDVVSKLALAHPEVDFSLQHRSRTAIRAPIHKNGLERVSLILGTRLGRQLFPIEGEENGVRVTAYLGAPELCQTTSRSLFLFVGRRAVRDRGLLAAIGRGYGELVPRGRYPVAVVKVEVCAADVDVNVHPQKLEVRFSDAQKVYSAVRHVVARGVASAPWLAESVAQVMTFRDQAGQVVTPPMAPMVRDFAAAQQRAIVFPMGPPAETDSRQPTTDYRPPTTDHRPPTTDNREPVTEGFFSALRYIGQLDRTFLLCERSGEMILVDQHAAHERVVFERLRARHKIGQPASQPLLFPEVLETSLEEAARIESFTDELTQAGFVLEPFGDSGQRASVALKATPAGLRDKPGAVVLELLRELCEFDGSRAVEERFDLVLATIACHSSVRSGDVLSPPEVLALFSDLDRIEYRAHCPHGRPVLLRISLSEIARRFGRSA